MRKAFCLALALLMLLAFAACDNRGNPGASGAVTTPAFSLPAAQIAGDSDLSAFFSGDAAGKVEAMSGAVCSFACAVQMYPAALSSVPDENFGWVYLYNLIVYNGVTCEGVSVAKDGFSVSEEALEKLQRDTLGGAVWSSVGGDMAEYVSYNESRASYTVRTGRPQTLGAYVESAAYRADASCAELIVAVYDSAAGADLESATVGRYCIDLRPSEESDYGYVIAAFSRAE